MPRRRRRSNPEAAGDGRRRPGNAGDTEKSAGVTLAMGKGRPENDGFRVKPFR